MRTSKDEALRGVSKIRDGVYLIRIQRIDERTGLGTDVRKRVEAKSMQEAIERRARLARELAEAYAPTPRVRLEDFARSWLRGRLPSLKASTRKRYADALDRFIAPALGKLYLDALRVDDVSAWFSALASSSAASTANGHLRVLRAVMRDAVAQHGLRVDPSRHVRMLPEGRNGDGEPVNILSAAEMGGFLAALKVRWPEWYALVFVQFAGAMRFGEVSALRWEDVDDARGVLKVRRAQWRTIVSTTKTRSWKTVPLTVELREVLTAWRRSMLEAQHPHLGTGLIFPSRAGKPHHNASCMRKAFIDCLKEIEVGRRLSSHGMRRTANDLLRRVASGEVTRAITGHVTEAMTEHYSHVDDGEKRVAVEGMLRLLQRPEASNEAPAGTSAGTSKKEQAQKKTAGS